MRRAAILTGLVFLVAGCQTASVPASVDGSLGPTVQVAATACAPAVFGMLIANGPSVAPQPVGSPLVGSVPIPAAMQGRLGAYGDSQDVVLAPLGWTCSAQEGDSNTLSVAPTSGEGFI